MTSNNNTDNRPYRPCVGIALFNARGQVFVGERIDTPGSWQMPQGGIDTGENPTQTAMRELKEEIGTNNAEIIKISDKKIRYDLPNDLSYKLWNGKYRGQEQTWVAARFAGEDNEINLNSFTPPEFKQWQWVELNKVIDLIVPFKRDIYRKVIDMFEGL